MCPKPLLSKRAWVGTTHRERALFMLLLVKFLVDQAVLVFDRYQEGVSCSVFFFVALAVVLYFDDDCL